METESKLTLEQLDALIAQANSDGLKAATDWVKAIMDKDKAYSDERKADADFVKYTKMKHDLLNQPTK